MTLESQAVPGLATRVAGRRYGRWPLVLLLVALGVLAVGGYLAYTRIVTPAAPAISGQITTVRRGSIVSSVSTTGTVVATTQASLAFGVAGKVKSVEVKVGDSVKAGQLLSSLDDTQLQIKLEQARSNLRTQQIKLDALMAGADSQDIVAARAALASAQANYESAVSKLQALEAGATDADIQAAQSAVDTAQANLQSAQAKLDQLRAGPTQADIAAAEAGVVSAKANLASAEQKLADLKARPKPEDVRAAELALEQARNSLWAAQIDRDAACGRGSDDPSCLSGKARVAAAETNVSSAMAKLEAARQPASADEVRAAEEAVASARAALASAQAKLDQVKSGPTDADLQAAQSAVDSATANFQSAQAKLQQLLTGASEADLRAARSAVASAKSGVESAQAKLDALLAGAKDSDLALQREAVRQAELSVKQAELDLDNATLEAPFDGVVTAINANVGEQVGTGGAAVTIVDPRAIRIDAQVDESDIAKVTVGRPAEITFDAIPGRRFRGTVASLAPKGTSQQGVVTYPVILNIEAEDVLLPAGLTAAINIIIEQKDNVLVVPSRAIRRQGRDQVVEVVKDGKTERRSVRTGVSNDQMVEVVDGLQEGEQVLIPGTTTAPPRVGGFGGGFGGGNVIVAPGPQPVVKPGR